MLSTSSYYPLAVAVALKFISVVPEKKKPALCKQTISMKFQSHTLKIASFITIM